MTEVELKAVIVNAKAVRALQRALELAEELEEDMPWREEPKKLRKAIRYAGRHLTVGKADS